MTTDTAQNWLPRWLIRIALLYFLLGVLLGNYMGASMNVALRPVHVHLLLLGWVSLGMAGLLYHRYPHAARSPLARWHFWLANISLPPMMVSLGMMMHGSAAAGPVVGITSVVMGIAVFLLVINIFRNDRLPV